MIGPQLYDARSSQSSAKGVKNANRSAARRALAGDPVGEVPTRRYSKYYWDLRSQDTRNGGKVAEGPSARLFHHTSDRRQLGGQWPRGEPGFGEFGQSRGRF